MLSLALTAIALTGQDTVTYRRDLAPVFAAKCVSCHVEGGPAPFPLTTYAEVRKRGTLIRTVVSLEKMPPTLVHSDFGPVARSGPLSSPELVALQKWLREGMPEGQGDVPLPPKPDDWQLGPPDLIVKSPKVVVPAEGVEVVRTVTLELPTDSAKDFVAFDIRPTAPKAMRQALLAQDAPNAFTLLGLDPERFIGPWAIGYHPLQLPAGSAFALNPGQKLRVRALYHATGKNEDGSFELALYFAKTAVEKKPEWQTLGSRTFELTGEPPAYTSLQDILTVSQSRQVISVFPEARDKAVTIRLQAHHRPAWDRTLLSIIKWDKRWSGAYNFTRPMILPANTTLEATIQYDNSNHDPNASLDENKRLPNNPSVFFGPKESDELFWIHVLTVPYP